MKWALMLIAVCILCIAYFGMTSNDETYLLIVENTKLSNNGYSSKEKCEAQVQKLTEHNIKSACILYDD